MLGLYESFLMLIVGIIIYVIAIKVSIENIVNKILYAIGLILIIIGVGFLIYNIVVQFII